MSCQCDFLSFWGQEGPRQKQKLQVALCWGWRTSQAGWGEGRGKVEEEGADACVSSEGAASLPHGPNPDPQTAFPSENRGSLCHASWVGLGGVKGAWWQPSSGWVWAEEAVVSLVEFPVSQPGMGSPRGRTESGPAAEARAHPTPAAPGRHLGGTCLSGGGGGADFCSRSALARGRPECWDTGVRAALTSGLTAGGSRPQIPRPWHGVTVHGFRGD